MRSEDKQNEYFEDYGFLSNESHQSEDHNFFLSENSVMVDFKEPLSLCISENQAMIQEEMDVKLQPTGIPTKNSPKRVLPTVPALKPDQNQILFHQETIGKYKEVYQGKKDDTVELNINFKTILANYFKEMIQANELNQQEVQHISQFIKRLPSFQSLKKLFEKKPETSAIRQICMIFLGSSECMKRVLACCCKMKTKMQMIKFIEKVRLNLKHPDVVIKWKDVYRPEKHQNY